MDQRNSNSIMNKFGYVFIIFGILVLVLGLSLLGSDNKGSFEFTLITLFLLSGAGLIYGGMDTIQKTKTKEAEVDIYEKQINDQLRELENSIEATKHQATYQNSTNKTIVSEKTISNKIDIDVEKPDIIALWEYSPEEWKLMNHSETSRRLKEGIWVSLGIGLIGGWVLNKFRGTSFMFGFLFALGIGVFVSALKIFLSKKLFSAQPKNKIIITSNALIINGKFETLNDSMKHLEYVKVKKNKGNIFLEFSLNWQTRSGPTNDQIRIYVPSRYENEIEKVVDYFTVKGFDKV